MKKRKKFDNTDVIIMVQSIPHTLNQIENELGMPKTSLSKVMNETRGMPKRWKLKLESFVEKSKNQ